MSSIEIRTFEQDDYKSILELWKSCEGIGLSQADTESSICRFLDQNPGLSHLACEGDQIIAAVLCGQDGRRGYLHHLAVHPEFRRRGIGGNLVRHCLEALARMNIQKCHLFIFRDNQEGVDFWENEGWTVRRDLHIMSRSLDGI
jgi:putative acetyltransferase